MCLTRFHFGKNFICNLQSSWKFELPHGVKYDPKHVRFQSNVKFSLICRTVPLMVVSKYKYQLVCWQPNFRYIFLHSRGSAGAFPIENWNNNSRRPNLYIPANFNRINSFIISFLFDLYVFYGKDLKVQFLSQSLLITMWLIKQLFLAFFFFTFCQLFLTIVRLKTKTE